MVIGIAVILFIPLALSVYMYCTAKMDRIIYQELLFKDFPKSFQNVNIFFISDLHKRVVSDKLIKKVKNKVDFVIIGGDLTEGGVAFAQVEKNLMKLKQLGPLFFVWGNNDYEVNARELDALLLKHRVTILANTAATFESNTGEIIQLLGIDDINIGRDRLDLALSDCTNEGFRILVSHNPEVKEQLVQKNRISLVLSGHTHGGQIRLFGYGPYELGKTELENNCIYVTSNGYGTSFVPLRLGAKPETHVLSLGFSEKTSERIKEVVRL